MSYLHTYEPVTIKRVNSRKLNLLLNNALRINIKSIGAKCINFANQTYVE